MVALKESQEWRSITAMRRLPVSGGSAGHVIATTDSWLPEAVGLEGVFAPVNRKIQVSLGPVSRAEGCVRRHLAWRAASQAQLFPVMEGSVTAISDGRSECVLEVHAHYQPPFGRVGQLVDRALLHLVASASIERFADEVAAQVESSVRQLDAEPVEGERRPEDQD